MKFSCFARFGHLRFAAGDPLSKRIYLSMRSNFGPNSFNIDVSPTNYQEAKLFAMSMGLARSRLALECANKQLRPARCRPKLPSYEKDYRIVPSGAATIQDRQRELAARVMLQRGSKEGAIVPALQTLLGANFVAYRETKPAEVITWPATPESVGTYARPDNVLKRIQLLDPVIIAGVNTIRYNILNAPNPTTIDAFDPSIGEKFTIEPEVAAVAEAVTITDVINPGGTGVRPFSIKATFAKAHSVGCAASNGPYPLFTSNQREVRVIVKSAVIVDPETRRKINDLMRRAVKGVTRWQILEEGSPGFTSVWTVPNRLIGKSILPLTI